MSVSTVVNPPTNFPNQGSVGVDHSALYPVGGSIFKVLNDIVKVTPLNNNFSIPFDSLRISISI